MTIPEKYFSVSIQTAICFILIPIFVLLVSSPTLSIIRLTPLSWIIAIIGISVFMIYLSATLKLNKNIFYICLLYFILLIYTSFTAYIAGQINTRIVVEITSLFGYIGLMMFVLYPIVKIYFSARPLFIYKVYVYAVSIHSILTIFFFINPEIRIAIQPVFQLSEFGHETLERGWRAVGINAHGGEAIAISHAIALFMIARLSIKKMFNIKLAIFLIFLIISSLVLMNRIGLVIGLFGLFFGIVFPIHHKGYRFRFVFGLTITLIISFLVFLQISQKYSPRALDRTLEAYYAYKQYGEFTTSTTEIIFGRMMFIPDVPFLYGDGRYGVGQTISMQKSSDVGYVRLFNGGGIIAILLWILLPIVFIFASNKEKESRAFAYFLSLTWLIANIKVLWISPSGGPALSVALLLILNKIENEKKLSPNNSI